VASLRYSRPVRDRIGFSLQLLGYENGRGLGFESAQGKINFDFNFDWFECRLTIHHPKKTSEPFNNSMDHQELPFFIQWLRVLPTKNNARYETYEPFFRIEVNRSGDDTFDMNLLPHTIRVSTAEFGLAVKFHVSGSQIVSFAYELEGELAGLQAKYSREIELWNQYKETMEKRERVRRSLNGQQHGYSQAHGRLVPAIYEEVGMTTPKRTALNDLVAEKCRDKAHYQL